VVGQRAQRPQLPHIDHSGHLNGSEQNHSLVLNDSATGHYRHA
jgi:hypothetical protein